MAITTLLSYFIYSITDTVLYRITYTTALDTMLYWSTEWHLRLLCPDGAVSQTVPLGVPWHQPQFPLTVVDTNYTITTQVSLSSTIQSTLTSLGCSVEVPQLICR